MLKKTVLISYQTVLVRKEIAISIFNFLLNLDKNCNRNVIDKNELSGLWPQTYLVKTNTKAICLKVH